MMALHLVWSAPAMALLATLFVISHNRRWASHLDPFFFFNVLSEWQDMPREGFRNIGKGVLEILIQLPLASFLAAWISVLNKPVLPSALLFALLMLLRHWALIHPHLAEGELKHFCRECGLSKGHLKNWRQLRSRLPRPLHHWGMGQLFAREALSTLTTTIALVSLAICTAEPTAHKTLSDLACEALSVSLAATLMQLGSTLTLGVSLQLTLLMTSVLAWLTTHQLFLNAPATVPMGTTAIAACLSLAFGLRFWDALRQSSKTTLSSPTPFAVESSLAQSGSLPQHPGSRMARSNALELRLEDMELGTTLKGSGLRWSLRFLSQRTLRSDWSTATLAQLFFFIDASAAAFVLALAD